MFKEGDKAIYMEQDSPLVDVVMTIGKYHPSYSDNSVCAVSFTYAGTNYTDYWIYTKYLKLPISKFKLKRKLV